MIRSPEKFTLYHHKNKEQQKNFSLFILFKLTYLFPLLLALALMYPICEFELSAKLMKMNCSITF